MVGRLVSFWDGFLAGAMLVSGSVYEKISRFLSLPPTKKMVHQEVNQDWNKYRLISSFIRLVNPPLPYPPNTLRKRGVSTNLTRYGLVSGRPFRGASQIAWVGKIPKASCSGEAKWWTFTCSRGVGKIRNIHVMHLRLRQKKNFEGEVGRRFFFFFVCVVCVFLGGGGGGREGCYGRSFGVFLVGGVFWGVFRFNFCWRGWKYVGRGWKKPPFACIYLSKWPPCQPLFCCKKGLKHLNYIYELGKQWHPQMELGKRSQ